MIEWLWQYSSVVISELTSALLGSSTTTGRDILADLPYSIRGIKESMNKGGSYNDVLGYLLVGLGLIVGIWLLVSWRKNRRTPTTEDINNPDELFKSLLARLQLDKSDKEMIRELADQARLRHPTLCLLSPGLLAWTSQLYQTEKGIKALNMQKITRLNEICTALYDHKMPTSATGHIKPAKDTYESVTARQ